MTLCKGVNEVSNYIVQVSGRRYSQAEATACAKARGRTVLRLEWSRCGESIGGEVSNHAVPQRPLLMTGLLLPTFFIYSTSCLLPKANQAGQG